jgi:glycolate oxidase iron-sulfur subunit
LRQPGLAPGINTAAARVLDQLGIAVERVRGEQCCGALAHHLGATERALEQARANVDACCAALDAGAEAIVSSASACGLMVKDYVRRGRRWRGGRGRSSERGDSRPAEVLEPALRRASEVIRAARRRQSPCTLQHGQRVAGRAEALEAAGCTLTPTSEATLARLRRDLLDPAAALAAIAGKVAALTGKHLVIATQTSCLEHLRGRARFRSGTGSRSSFHHATMDEPHVLTTGAWHTLRGHPSASSSACYSS